MNRTVRQTARWMPAVLALLLVAGSALSACGPGAPTPTTRPAVPPEGPPAAAATSVPGAVPGTTLALEPGGSVFVPEGALPAGAQIRASRTQMPALPDDVEPVGDALFITATAKPTLPVTLRLPVPAGVTDPQNLAILRVEEDGNTTFLMTRVEKDELVAETLGFSNYVRVRLPSGVPAVVMGRPTLFAGEQSAYFLQLANAEARVTSSWAASGMATVVQQNAWSATIQAKDLPGDAYLHFRAVEHPSGRRWHGWQYIKVNDPARVSGSFRVSIVARPPVAYIGQDAVSVVASVHGDYQAPITWTWQFEDGGNGEFQTDAGTTQFVLPAGTYPPQDRPGRYDLTVWARDARGREFRAFGSYELREVEPLLVTVDGPARVRWSDPAVYQAYTARASEGQPPYGFRFELFPQADPSRPISFKPEDTGTVKFDQPGQYQLQVYAIDQQEHVTETSFIIVVTGGEPLSTRIVELPATADVDEQVAATVSIRGGVLVVGAKKAGYRLVVDWGDRSAPDVREDVGLKITPYQGIVFSRSHSYAAEGQYTVRIQAFDATGKSDWYAQEITISRAPATDPDTTAPQPMPMELPAKYLGTYDLVEPDCASSGYVELTVLTGDRASFAMKALKSSCPSPWVTEDGTVRFPKWTSYPAEMIQHADGAFAFTWNKDYVVRGTYDAASMQGSGSHEGYSTDVRAERVPMKQERP